MKENLKLKSKMNNKEIITQVESIMKVPVYLVGGSVRDEIIGKKSNDFDFATPLNPDAIEQKVREFGRHPLLVGKRFGTVGMILDNQKIEITTFRAESYQKGSRKPEVIFVNNLIADLSRRDFTINAMAMSSKKIIVFFKSCSRVSNCSDYVIV